MANIVYMARSAWTGLLDAIRSKASVSGTMTVSEATTAVENIETGGGGDENFDKLVEKSIISASGQASTIGEYAFFKCYSLEAIRLNSAVSIASYAFAYCSKLTSAEFRNANRVYGSAFASCYSLTTIMLDSCNIIDTTAFSDCSKLESISAEALTSIGSNAFYGCSNLTTFYAPSLLTIASRAFYNCTNLKEAIFPYLSDITGWIAFANCYSLSVFSSPVSRLLSSTFYNCHYLLSVYLTSNSVVYLPNVNVFNSTPISNYTTSTGGVHGSIFVPASLYDQYISASNWSLYSSRIVSVAE